MFITYNNITFDLDEITTIENPRSSSGGNGIWRAEKEPYYPTVTLTFKSGAVVNLVGREGLQQDAAAVVEADAVRRKILERLSTLRGVEVL